MKLARSAQQAKLTFTLLFLLNVFWSISLLCWYFGGRSDAVSDAIQSESAIIGQEMKTQSDEIPSPQHMPQLPTNNSYMNVNIELPSTQYMAQLPKKNSYSNFWCSNSGRNTCARSDNGNIVCQQRPAIEDEDMTQDVCKPMATCVLENVCFGKVTKLLIFIIGYRC